MSKKLEVADTLSQYFVSKGRIMSLGEYCAQGDRPMPVQTIKRVCGSWVRTLAIAENSFPVRMASLRADEAPVVGPVPAWAESVSVEASVEAAPVEASVEKSLKEILAELKGVDYE